MFEILTDSQRNRAAGGRTLHETNPGELKIFNLRRSVTIAVLTAVLSSAAFAYADGGKHPELGADADISLAPNDLRSNAKVIEELPYTDSVNNTLATPDNEGTYCPGYGSVWYSFTTLADIELEADTFGSDIETILAVYSPGENEPQECYHDGNTSKRRMSVRAGQQIEFRISGSLGYRPSSGNLVFNLAVRTKAPPPENDARSGAVQISALPFFQGADNSSATTESDEPSDCGLIRTLWYSYTATEDTFLEAEVNIYGEAGLAIYASDHPDQPIACTQDYYSADIGFTAFAGRTYQFQVGESADYGGATGGEILFSLADPRELERANDVVETAPTIGSLPFVESTSTEGMTLSDGEATPCGFIGSTTWYRFISSTDRTIDVTTKGSSFDTVTAVYSASDPSVAIACNDDLDGLEAGIRFTVTAGTEYLIQLGGRRGQEGRLEVRVDEAGPAPPDPDLGSSDEAVIRPGASIGNCTANFIFRGRGLRAGRVYLGTAAHCVDQSVGDVIYLHDDDAILGTTLFDEPIGQVAYSSYKEMDTFTDSCYLILSCAPDDDFNDFALIEIYPQFHGYVHPAMKNFGGPSSVARFDDVELGDKILSFGNSGLRPGPEQLDWHEGYVTGKAGQMEVDVTMTPGIFGDSGSPVILEDGRALGVLVTLTGTEPGTNGVTALQPAMDFALQGGWNLDLASSSLLAPGLLPSFTGTTSD